MLHPKTFDQEGYFQLGTLMHTTQARAQARAVSKGEHSAHTIHRLFNLDTLSNTQVVTIPYMSYAG